MEEDQEIEMGNEHRWVDGQGDRGRRRGGGTGGRDGGSGINEVKGEHQDQAVGIGIREVVGDG